MWFKKCSQLYDNIGVFKGFEIPMIASCSFFGVPAAPHKHVVNSDTAGANSAGAVLPGPLREPKKIPKKTDKKLWKIEFYLRIPSIFVFDSSIFGETVDFSGLQTFSLPMCQQLTQTDHRHRTSWLTADIAQIFKGLAPATKQRVAWSNEQNIGSIGRIRVYNTKLQRCLGVLNKGIFANFAIQSSWLVNLPPATVTYPPRPPSSKGLIRPY